jgi:hypothetical protein
MVGLACNPARDRRIMSSRPAWAIYQHPVSKTTTTKK